MTLDLNAVAQAGANALAIAASTQLWSSIYEAIQRISAGQSKQEGRNVLSDCDILRLRLIDGDPKERRDLQQDCADYLEYLLDSLSEPERQSAAKKIVQIAHRVEDSIAKPAGRAGSPLLMVDGGLAGGSTAVWAHRSMVILNSRP